MKWERLKDHRILRFTVKRLILLAPQLSLVTVSVFILIRLLPTDPVAGRIGLLATPEAYAQTERQLGLDKSIPEQLGAFLTDLGNFSLGRSWESSGDVLTEILQFLPITLQLIILSFLIAIVVAVPLGLVAALRPGGRADRGIFIYGLFAGAQPEFWWGLMFAFVFAFKLGIFPPPLGILDPHILPVPEFTHFILIDSLLAGRWDAFVSAMWHFLLPAISLAFVITGPIVKMTRQTMVRILGSDFVLHARARGLPGRQVARYALRNALPPVVTLVGILFGYMLGGAVLIEQVFSLNGLGQYALQRTLTLDFPAIQGVVLFMTGFSLVTYLFIDVLYSLIDPRIEL